MTFLFVFWQDNVWGQLSSKSWTCKTSSRFCIKIKPSWLAHFRCIVNSLSQNYDRMTIVSTISCPKVVSQACTFFFGITCHDMFISTHRQQQQSHSTPRMTTTQKPTGGTSTTTAAATNNYKCQLWILTSTVQDYIHPIMVTYLFNVSNH